MIESSVAYPAPSLQVEAIEREIARLRAARPSLSSRIERAESIVVTHLSCSNGTRPIRVRIHADGSRSYTVRSCAKLGRVYRVEVGTFACDCPDSRRRSDKVGSGACKHGIACWLIERSMAGTTPATSPFQRYSESPCSGCGSRVPNSELTEVQDFHESLTYFEGDMICGDCVDISDCY